MLSAKLIMPKRINELRPLPAGRKVIRFVLLFVVSASAMPVFAQDNSPYTRYGLGDLVPSTNVNSRGMGGISAAYNNFLFINYSNPASYGSFESIIEQKSKKQQLGRAILDVGLNFESRTLSQPGNLEKFTASNALFSHVQIGIPLKRNWGLSFGLRPVSRISYKIQSRELLPGIDSAITTNQGDGGASLASLGTGYKFNFGKHSLSLGINGGYLFGKKDYSARRSIINDSLQYNSGNFQTVTTFGNLYYNAGLQYRVQFNPKYSLAIGAFGNWEQSLNATQNVIRETYFFNENSGNVTLDSVYKNTSKGKIIYPSSLTVGFVIEKTERTGKESNWLVGVDFSQSKWEDYRYFGQKDLLRNKWELHVGGEYRPIPRRNYFSNIAYRAGFFTGPDYIEVQAGKKLPVVGGSVGLGLPVANYNRLSPGSATIINLAFEYIKRGNNDNLLKENLFRFSLGFSLSDYWFRRKKYE